MRRLFITSLIFVLFSCQNLFANNIAIMPKAGSTGLGADIIFLFSENSHTRVGMSTFNLNGNQDISGINYDYELQLSTIPVLLDYYPFALSPFRLSAGLIINNNELSVDAKASDSLNIKIGNNEYSLATLGKLQGELTFQKLCPYIGFGWGGHFNQGERFALLLDIGIMYHGKANITYTTTNELVNELLQEFKADIDIEKKALEDEIAEYPFFPVISLGFAFRF